MDEKRVGAGMELDDEDLDASQLDIAAAVQAAMFQDAPVRGPDWFKAAVAQKSSESKTAPGAFGLDPNSQEGRRAADAKRREDDMEEFASTVAQHQKQEREREEWNRTKSTIGSVTKTGKEWAELADRLRDDEELRRRVFEAFKARGMSDREAEARLERVRQVAEIAAIPPSQRTPEQKETVELAEADKSFKRDMADVEKADRAKAMSSKAGLSASFDNAAAGKYVELAAAGQSVTVPQAAPMLTGP